MGELLLDLEDIQAVVFDEITEEPGGIYYTADEVAVTNASSRCLLENANPNGIEQVCQHFASWRWETS
jgi:hypothetical protein